MPRLVEYGTALQLDGTFGAASIAGLAGGGFAQSFNVPVDTAQPDPEPQIRVDLVNASGTLIDLNGANPGSYFGIPYQSQAPHNGQSGEEIAALAGGGFVVTYRDTSYLREDGTKRALETYQTFDANGAPLANAPIYLPASMGTVSDVLGLEGGGFAVAYGTTASGSPLRNYGIIEFGGAGRTISLGSANNGRDASLSALGDGYVVAYSAIQGSSREVFAVTVDAAGAVSAPFQVNTAVAGTQDLNSSSNSIVELANGNFAVVWTTDDGTNAPTLQSRVFTPAGVPVNAAEVQVNVGDATGAGYAEVQALSGGGFAVVYKEGLENRIQRFDASGEKAGAVLTIETGIGEGPLAVTEMANGDLMVAYGFGPGDGRQFAQRILVSTDGTSGADTLTGTNDANALDGLAGADRLYGLGGDDVLFGGGGGDRLYGGTGADTMQGEADSDVFYVDNAGDVVKEGAGGGTADEVQATAGWTLQAGQQVEVLRATGGAIRLEGNELANKLYSGAGSDTLVGGPGGDAFYVNGSGDRVEEAGAGIDTVYASANWTLAAGQSVEFIRANAGGTGVALGGNELANTLVSGAGSDTLTGGLGGDTFYVNGAGDKVMESGAGVDTIFASAGFTLGAGQTVEYLRAQAGSVGIALGGNELTNTLVSGGGADTLSGGLGSDNYYVDGAGDQVVESGSGTDNVYASSDWTLGAGQAVEYIRANVGTDLALTGNELTNRLIGAAGSDTLSGGLGVDALTGNGGVDRFTFLTTAESGYGAGDTIVDMVRGSDRIDLTGIQAVEGAGTDRAFVFIGIGAAFTGVAGELRQRVSGTSSVLEGDTDGDRVADLQIKVGGTASLEADILL